jgi:xanthine dehydrogenase accessory factor
VGRFRRHLAAAGHSDAAINIGLPELRGKDPAVIAVGVAAQVIVAMAGASTFRL